MHFLRVINENYGQKVNARVDITSSSVMALQIPVPEGNIIKEYTRNVRKNKFTK